ncbi:HNH endonuclease [Hafnia paralvei]|uniref:HNH endonuclease n=1 Tax=Hafnia paralvei TaxID=546367 RepID=UPI001034BC6E|nr:HNH endonuclease [Hafnia paralvei]TBL64874.1 hypothetical protein EYY97_02180 [Hafnia paralvei]
MIYNAVSYDAQHTVFVNAFKKLDIDIKEKYWDTKGNNELDAIKKHIKDYYLLAQDYRCPYCQQKIIVTHNGAWDTEHIIPKDTHPNFMFEPQNLCISCKDCNGEKSNENILKKQKSDSSPQQIKKLHNCTSSF